MERDRPPPVPTRSESLRSDHGSPLLTPRSPSSGSLSIRKDLLPDRLLGSPRGQLGRHKLHADPMGRSLSPRRQARGENGARRGSFERQTRLDADAGFQRTEECELFPDHCYVYESLPLLIDLSSSCQFCLKDTNCTVEFFGERSSTRVFVDGFRRNHNYGIKTTTPVWYESEPVRVTVRTLRDQILAVGYFQVMEKTQPYVSIRLKKTSDWCNNMFIKTVIGAFVPVGLSDSSENCEFYMCIPESRATVTELLDKVIAFALANGLPQEVSIPKIFSNVPDLKRVLKASSYAMGSLDVMLRSVERQSRYEYVTDQITDLLARVEIGQGPPIVQPALKVQPVYSVSTKVTPRNKPPSADYSEVAISQQKRKSSLDVERFAPKGSEEEEPGYIQMSPVHRSTSSPRDSFLSQVKREYSSDEEEDSAFGDGYFYIDPSKPSPYARISPTFGPVACLDSNPKRGLDIKCPLGEDEPTELDDGYIRVDPEETSQS